MDMQIFVWSESKKGDPVSIVLSNESEMLYL